MQVGEESTMSDDVRGNLLGADESDWQEEETGLENDEYFDEDDFDPVCLCVTPILTSSAVR